MYFSPVTLNYTFAFGYYFEVVRVFLFSHVYYLFQCMLTAFETLYPAGFFRIITYTSRPLIRVRYQKDGPIRSYSFVDAIVALKPMSTSGLNMTDTDLQSTYKAAGARFEGQLRELFIILDDSSKHRILPVSARPSQSKRTRDNDDDDAQSISKKSNSESVTTNLAGRMQRNVKL